MAQSDASQTVIRNCKFVQMPIEFVLDGTILQFFSLPRLMPFVHFLILVKIGRRHAFRMRWKRMEGSAVRELKQDRKGTGISASSQKQVVQI